MRTLKFMQTCILLGATSLTFAANVGEFQGGDSHSYVKKNFEDGRITTVCTSKIKINRVIESITSRKNYRLLDFSTDASGEGSRNQSSVCMVIVKK